MRKHSTAAALLMTMPGWTLALPLGGCGSDTPAAAGFESKLQMQLGSPDGVPVVRSLDSSHDIELFALGDEYLFFSSNWNGVFRVPKFGGAVEAVEEDHAAITGALAANARDVFWERVRFDGNGFPLRKLLRRSTDLGPASTLRNDDFDALLPEQRLMEVDDAHLVIRHLQDGVPEAISLADGTTVRIPAEPIDVTDIFPRAGSFVLDGNTLFAAACSGDTCALARGDVTTGAAAIGPSLSGLSIGLDDPVLAAADDAYLYLIDWYHVWRLRKSDWASEEVYRAPSGAYVGRPFVVDDRAVYFVTTAKGGEQLELVAVAKTGGTLRVLSTRPHLAQGICQVAQDAQYLFVLAPTDDGLSMQILVVAKD